MFSKSASVSAGSKARIRSANARDKGEVFDGAGEGVADGAGGAGAAASNALDAAAVRNAFRVLKGPFKPP
jgi:hypothetical protein